MKCKVCGRTEEELEEEFGIESAVEEHQGIQKCEKCRREYQRETGNEQQTESDDSDVDADDWKEAVTA